VERSLDDLCKREIFWHWAYRFWCNRRTNRFSNGVLFSLPPGFALFRLG